MFERIGEKIGFILMALGTMVANSDCILIPVVVVGLGAMLVLNGLGKEENDEEV